MYFRTGVTVIMTLLVKSELLNFQEHRSALLHTMASVSLAFQCRL